MCIVSFITDPRVVDRILRHGESGRCKTQDPFESRAPPGAAEGSRVLEDVYRQTGDKRDRNGDYLATVLRAL